MKPFLVKVAIFGTTLLAVGLGIFLLEGGYSDAFYLRFTSPPQTALITGNSRAAQGLKPSVINGIIDTVYATKLYNYAFTLSNSAYGKVYFNSISKKLDDSVRDGVFIVTVDPWSISVISDDPNDENTFPEKTNFLADMDNVSAEPNLDYLLNHYSDPYYNIILRRLRPSHLRLHNDGWLEVSVKMDSASVEERTLSKFKQYDRNARQFKFSETRFRYLVETIKLFKAHGDVYMVRLPVAKGLLDAENNLMPDFTPRMEALAREYDVPYLDMTPDFRNYRYTDGNHLFKSSSEKVSQKIATWIVDMKTIKLTDDALVVKQ